MLVVLLSFLLSRFCMVSLVVVLIGLLIIVFIIGRLLFMCGIM